jgi:N-acetylmuramoyl-L-alanine amidase
VLKKGLILLFVLILFCGALPISARDVDETIPYDARLWVDGQLIDNPAGYLAQKGNMLVPAQVVERMGASFQWTPEEWKIRITSENRRLVMYVNNFQCANGTKVEKMPAYPVLFQGMVMIPLRYVAENLGSAVLWSGKDIYVSTTGEIPVVDQVIPDAQKTNLNEALPMKKTVVLDPGHGGSDPGAVAGKVQEKDLNLQVAKILKGMLDEAGLTVYMTRSEDKYVGLYTRADIANHLGADLFVSIHHNASPNTSAQGLMTLYYPTSSSKQKMNGQKLAEIIQKNLLKELKTRDWGIIPRPNLVVTRETKMPAVIAELGFITNKAELERLVTYQFQKQAAQALYAGILEALAQ